MTSYSCKSCNQVFATKSTRNAHRLDCPERTDHTLTVGGKEVTVLRGNKNGTLVWLCCCGSNTCKKQYAKWQALKAHLTTSKATTWLDMVSKICYEFNNF